MRRSSINPPNDASCQPPILRSRATSGCSHFPLATSLPSAYTVTSGRLKTTVAEHHFPSGISLYMLHDASGPFEPARSRSRRLFPSEKKSMPPDSQLPLERTHGYLPYDAPSLRKRRKNEHSRAPFRPGICLSTALASFAPVARAPPNAPFAHFADGVSSAHSPPAASSA